MGMDNLPGQSPGTSIAAEELHWRLPGLQSDRNRGYGIRVSLLALMIPDVHACRSLPNLVRQRLHGTPVRWSAPAS
jgi:hypothetical protein